MTEMDIDHPADAACSVLVPALPPMGEDLDLVPALMDTSMESESTISVHTVGIQRSGHGIGWGDFCGEYLLGSNVTEWIAHDLVDEKGNQIMLSKKDSIWYALQQLNYDGVMIPPKSRRFKFPSHVVATDSWDATLTNIIQFCFMSEKEQALERQRFKEASSSDKKVWNRFITRLHKSQNRRSKFNVPRGTPMPPSFVQPQIQEPVIGEPVQLRRVGARVLEAERQRATARAVVHASDPDRMQRIREMVGYDPSQDITELDGGEAADPRSLRRQARFRARDELQQREEGAVVDHLGVGSSNDGRDQLVVDEFQTRRRRKYGDPPNSSGQQTDGTARSAVKSALLQTARYIQTIHFPGNDEMEQPVHSMVLVALNELKIQTNRTGGRCAPGQAADKPELTILAYDEETCVKIVNALCDQFLGPSQAGSPGSMDSMEDSSFTNAYNEHIIFKKQNKTLEESVSDYLSENADASWAQPRRRNLTINEVQESITPGPYTQVDPVHTTTPASALIMLQAREGGNNERVELQTNTNTDNNHESDGEAEM